MRMVGVVENFEKGWAERTHVDDAPPYDATLQTHHRVA